MLAGRQAGHVVVHGEMCVCAPVCACVREGSAATARRLLCLQQTYGLTHKSTCLPTPVPSPLVAPPCLSPGQVIINLPSHIQLLSMSATVRNPEDLGGWITQVGGWVGGWVGGLLPKDA